MGERLFLPYTPIAAASVIFSRFQDAADDGK
jgi:hypothetical protein